MRWLPAVLLLGCSTTTVTVLEHGDAAAVVPDEAGEPDSGAEAAVAPGCPRNAPQANCVPAAIGCAKGSGYTCQGPACPTGAVGSCSLASVTHVTDYDERDDWCCEKAACVRSIFGDSQCQHELDGRPRDGGAGRVMWVCPYANGSPLATPPGSCVLNGLPSPGVRDIAGEYCCR